MGTIRDTVSDLARERGEFPQFSPEVDLAPLADATETAIAAVAFDAEDIGYDNTDSDLTADNAQAAIDEIVVRVEALEDVDPPAPSGNYDVTVVCWMATEDVGKLVRVSGGTATPYQGVGVPAGVLISLNIMGVGVVRRWGAATCKFGAGLPSEGTLLKGDDSGLMVAAGLGSGAVVGRVLAYAGSGTGTVFVTAISTYGMLAA